MEEKSDQIFEAENIGHCRNSVCSITKDTRHNRQTSQKAAPYLGLKKRESSEYQKLFEKNLQFQRNSKVPLSRQFFDQQAGNGPTKSALKVQKSKVNEKILPFETDNSERVALF